MSVFQAIGDFAATISQEVSAHIAYKLCELLRIPQRRWLTLLVQFLLFGLVFVPLYVALTVGIIYGVFWLIVEAVLPRVFP
jgi:hypothetical protein